ncbi:MAG: UvrD-helicase domain-containing protein, partial [Eggerthellaceae bacterium]|nr:UvrD-helicase domain-containing protein [Eggerthellaceae bacterium]
MRLSSLTDDQRICVKHCEGPLLISAGAGSGKTFTLTQRIAWALQPPGPLQDISEVLAITFTEKAAAEIKARVRSTLRQNGLTDQALRVDEAWISTIHGMCARILRMHALELGIDPGFTVIDEALRKDLIAEAINDVLRQGKAGFSPDCAPALFDEYVGQSYAARASSVTSMLETLIDKAANQRNGFDDFSFGPEATGAAVLARDMLAAYEELGPAFEMAGKSELATSAKAQAAEMMEALGRLLAQWEGPEGPAMECKDSADAVLAKDGSQAEPAASDDEAARIAALARLLDSCTVVSRRFGSAQVKEMVALWQAKYHRIAEELALALARPAFKELIGLARQVLDRFEEKKHAAFVLDNNDLLLQTLNAFNRYPELAQAYEDRFKLVMVDEFQDTSQIQIDIIERLAGKNSQRLCTVGDSQQSIYRFRGADVNVYEQHCRKMRSKRVGALYVELKKNFRSHGDILQFVDSIFGQEQVFGEGFMSLVAHQDRQSSLKAAGPRIDIVLAMMPGGNNSGVGIDDAKYTEARSIAQRFAAFKEAGQDLGDMVILLGKMTRAEVFAKALRARGLECVVTGGSLFDKAPEVLVVSRLVEVLANPANTSALFEVLESGMFRLSAEDLIGLSTLEEPESGIQRRCDLHFGFNRLEKALQADAAALPMRLSNAVNILGKAKRSLGFLPIARIVETAILESGWIVRLEASGVSGIARAANILKAIRFIDKLERERKLGIARLAIEFSGQLAMGVKEPPGALSGNTSGVVKIMSIHAAKGLEFPIVALAEFSGVRASGEKLVIECCDGKAYASLYPAESLLLYPRLKQRLSGFSPFDEESSSIVFEQSLKNAPDQGIFRAALKAYAQEQELAELRRKLYVGLTRASEALVVSVSARSSSKDVLLAYKDVVDDIRSALCGNRDFPEKEALLDYGGSQSAAFERIAVSTKAARDAAVGAEEAKGLAPAKEDFFVPAFESSGMPPERVYSPLRRGVFSYSSLSKAVPVSSVQPPTDTDKASELGSAFHLLARLALERGRLPGAEQIKRIGEDYRLSEKGMERLRDALSRWFGSELYSRVLSFRLKAAELPFFVPVEDAWLEGDIDLFCSDGQKGAALVIDYKTGGSAEEDASALYEKHLLQASCYAYAVLL